MTEGILPVCKPPGCTSFHLVSLLRRLTGIRTIGHAGTLDPFAEGVMILLIGRPFTRLSGDFLHQDKEYETTVRLGIATDTFDCDGHIVKESALVPTQEAVDESVASFQGEILQVPPMFSAKKVGGKKLYDLARKGITIEREAARVTVETTLLSYVYPDVTLRVRCSKGTYIRAIAEELGEKLGCGGHLTRLVRTRSGPFTLAACCDGARLTQPDYPWQDHLCTSSPA